MSRLKTLLLGSSLALASSGAFAQVSSYGFSASQGTFDTLGSSGTIVPSVSADENLSAALPIGFTFEFSGNSYSTVKVSSNGFLTFGTSTASQAFNDLDGAVAASLPVIAPLWDDLDGSANGGSTFTYETQGTAPNRVFIAEWKKFEWRYNSNDPVISFQAKLYETTNTIDFVYRPESGTPVSPSASIGLAGSTSGDFISVAATGSSPMTSTTTEVSNLSTSPVAGQVYTFTPPSCLAPTNLAVANITTTSADLGYNSPNSSGTFMVEVVTSGTAPGVGTVNTGLSYSINTLSASTGYDFYVREVCAAGDTSSWTGPLSFATDCNASSVPYFEGFESMTSVGTGIVPTCWAEDGDWVTADSPGSNNRQPRTGSNYVHVNYNATDWLYTAPVDLVAGTTYDFSYYYSTDGLSGWDSINAYVGTAQDIASMNPIGTSIQSPINTSYLQSLNEFTPTTSGAYYFAIRVKANGAPWYISIDDISVTLTPNCVAPVALSASNVQANQADLTWTGQSTGSDFQITVLPAGQTPASTGTVVSTNSYTAMNLNPTTDYEFFVRQICSVGDTSSWSNAGAFTTPCLAATVPYFEGFENMSSVGTGIVPDCWAEDGDWVTANAPTTYNRQPRTDSNYIHVNWSATDALYTAPISLTAGTSYDFSYFYSTDGNNGWDSLNAYVGTSPDVTTMTSIGNTIYAPTNMSYLKSTNTFVPTTTGVYYFALRVKANGSPWYLSFDDFEVVLTPTCIAPNNVVISNVTTTSATVDWNPVTTGNDYEVAFLPQGTMPTGNGVAVSGTTTYTANNLTGGTNYNAFVRQICSPGDTSAWSIGVSFQTAFVAPYFTNFDSLSDGDDGALDNGWAGIPSTGYAFEVGAGTTPTTASGPEVDHTTGTSAGLYVYTEASNGSSGDTAILESPFIDITTLSNPELSFWYHRYGSNFETGYIQVLSSGAWTTIDSIVGETQTSNTANYLLEKSSLVGYSGVIKVRFLSIKGGSYNGDWAIDDVSIAEGSPYDLGLYQLDVITDECLSATDTVRVLVKNDGTQPFDFAVNNATINVNVTGNTSSSINTTLSSGTLVSGADTLIEVGIVDLSVGGSFNALAYVTSVPDSFSINDTVVGASIYGPAILALPQFVDFEGFTGANLPSVHANWYESGSPVVLAGTTSDWINSNSTQTAALGSTTARINLYSSNDEDWIFAGKFTPNTGDSIFFSAAVTDWNNSGGDSMGSDDYMAVRISTDCGSSWTDAFKIDTLNEPGNVLTPFAVDISAYYGQEIMVGFMASEGTVDDSEDYDFHIDNIIIGSQTGNDLAIENVTKSIADTVCDVNTMDLDVLVKNLALGNTNGVSVDLSVNGTSINESITDTLSFNDTATVSFSGVSLNAGVNTIAIQIQGTDNDTTNNYDTLTVYVGTAPTSSAVDGGICAGGNYVIDAGASADSYIWSNGATTQTITVTAADIYKVTLTDAYGCSSIDSVEVVDYPTPAVDLGADKSFCKGDSVTLDAGSFASYAWTGGANTQTLVAKSAGDYMVTVTSAEGCTNVDTITIGVWDLPVVDLGNDTLVEGSIVLDAGAGFTSYTWNDLTTNQTLKAETTGEYSVRVVDANGCTATDTINVEVEPVSVNGLNQVSVTAFPNPNNGVFNIVADFDGQTSIEVINVNGQVVKQKETTITTGVAIPIDLGNVAAGLYTVKLKSNKAIAEFRITVE